MEYAGMQSAETGTIYEFFEADGTVKNMVLVLQNEKRAEENLVSVLMLGTKKGGSDTVPIKLPDNTYYVHCGLITYCRRERLGEIVDYVDNALLTRIKNGVAWQLGLSANNIDYKKLYEQLLEKVTN